MISILKRVAGAITLLAMVATARPAGAQITTGSVIGTVKDAQGGVLPGATVVLVSEARSTRSNPVVTNEVGDFVFVNVATGTYAVEVTMSGFKTLRRAGVAVSSGSRSAVGTLTLELGGTTETVDVKASAPIIQATTGERSFTVPTDSVENLPIANRSFTQLALLAPGVAVGAAGGGQQGATRAGGGGGNNIMMDGVSAVDTGSNAVMLQMNVESIAEVKVLTSGYQAEYGRSSGLQISAVTKSGTNRFHGSVYDVERNSDWNANSRVNILNGDAKAVSKQRDIGYSLGGPIGKPGGSNKLFFFYAHEFAPRTSGGTVSRFRVPTELERKGDFSKTYDNLGAPYPYIKDPNVAGACSATSQVACFQDGNVVGRIPASALYQPGLAILNQWPLPNLEGAGLGYNYEFTRPTEKALAWQPAVRIDYQPTSDLRATFKYSGWRQTDQTFLGTIPGFNDSRMSNPVVSTTAYTLNYTMTPTTFVEVIYGHSQNELSGCAPSQAGSGPGFCTGAIPMSPIANRATAGLADFPMLFPDALILNPDYYAYGVMTNMQPDFFQDGVLYRTPVFNWGSRVANAPPNQPFSGGALNINSTHDVAVSVTKVVGKHTIKGGFYNTNSYKAQQSGSDNTFGVINFQQDAAGTNLFDTSFGFSNAATGTFSSYQQQSTYIEGSFVYRNTEGYLQDNWKVAPRISLDYGVRLVNQQPQYDKLGQASNFLPETWSIADAPALYVIGCANGAVTCTGTNRQAKNPITGAFLGANSTLAAGTLVPGTGDRLNGLFLSGQGIAKTTYTWPALGIAPRFGMAFDATGDQRFVLRGGLGLYYDRPSGNSVLAQVANPPSVRNVIVRYGQLQSLGAGGLTTEGAPALSVFEYDGGLPSSTQWNVGAQMALPWSSSFDIAYVGQHAWNQYIGVNINAVDIGSAFLPQNQDTTQTPSATPGATAVVTDLMRAVRGYGAITQQQPAGWNTYHSFQLSLQRRFSNGVSFGLTDTVSLSNVANTALRLQHAADGTYTLRDDQAAADDLLQTDPVLHTMKANFVWDLPDIASENTVWRTIGWVANDWQLSGIWTGSTAAPYTVGFSYSSGGSSVNLTGSPDYAARVRVVGDTGSGCSNDIYRQFTAEGFQGPLTNSVGLESGNNVVKGCFQSVLDLSIARNIRLGGGKNLQLRVDLFNAPNSAIITGRNATMNLSSPSDPATITNLPYDANGLVQSRLAPRSAGFGVANNYQAARSVQLQARFSF